jgi:hypothetical protein
MVATTSARNMEELRNATQFYQEMAGNPARRRA